MNLSSSMTTDFDLTGQLVWPGAMLLNDYLSKNAELLQGCTVLELGSGVGITGILCSRFCSKVVLTDHNEEFSKESMDSLVISEAVRCGMQINELVGTRSVVGNLEGVIFEVTLKKQDE
ncbi:Putative methyltransferase family protein [Prunus dulcis]|uniref:Methyltransferase family protein n=1 Tax=Prunus dulcis TaxID=3755 RepID=A0A4Y1REG0_PRUDU|nr:Putative methyltransferase family protein [Prunus dulcis]